ncbi:MAG: aminotransferase class V-fold PLP-dependent enzyme [Proteobacteria bacterium]|nr:aminotransferase class V-fold PLP-dependent enzyme [Pseudomonadota bacterium]
MLNGASKKVNESLKKYSPMQIILAAYGALLVPLLYAKFRRLTPRELLNLKRRIYQSMFRIPFLGPYLRKEADKKLEPVFQKLELKIHNNRKIEYECIPEEGVHEEVIMQKIVEDCKSLLQGDKMSGANYYEVTYNLPKFVGKIAEQSCYTNHMHTAAWDAIKQRENEVIEMVAQAYNGKDIRGNITPGGSYSVFEAMGAYSKLAEELNIKEQPNVIAPSSIHPCFEKACEKFKLNLIKVPVYVTGRADIQAMEKAIDKNTICFAISASNFPTGSLDDVSAFGDIAQRRGIGLHVDGCIGGVTPFAEAAGVKIPVCDFRVAGITSYSVDAHKFFMCPKGTSIIMFRLWAFKRQGFVALNSSVGSYVTVNMAGSRSGELVLTVWGILLRIGKKGFVQITKDLFSLTNTIIEGIKKIEGLQIWGSPDLTTFAFAFDDSHAHLNIHLVSGLMSEKEGWYFINIGRLDGMPQRPFVHFTLTAHHLQDSKFADRFLSDLKKHTKTVIENPNMKLTGDAATYASLGEIPSAVAEPIQEEIGVFYNFSNSSLRKIPLVADEKGNVPLLVEEFRRLTMSPYKS